MKRPAFAVGATIAAVTTAAATTVALATPARAATTPPIPVGWPAVSSATQTAPVRLAPGVTAYSEDYVTVDGPEHAELVSVDLTRHGVRLDTVESHDRIVDPANETTTSMGDRTGALAGINGDYFAIRASGSPLGGVISHGRLLKSPRPNYQAQLRVERDGRVRIGRVDFRGTVRDATAATAVTSRNTVTDAAAGGISQLTPDLGATTVTAGTLVIGRRSAGRLVVQEVRTSVTSVPALGPGQQALLGSGRGGTWLQQHVQRGEKLAVTASTTVPAATALISGATVLVRQGRVYDDPTGTPPRGRNPETMVGVSRDGRHLLLVVIDGRQPTHSIGVTPLEASQYLVAHGVDSGILLDGGGSSTLAARLPGTASLTIRNTVSDAAGERPVANGLFLYRTA